jgi:Leucine-rich repeat (LRR) protein
LNNNQIKNIHFTTKNTSILNLLINDNQIKTIGNIEYLVALESLSLNNNNISEMPNVKNPNLINLSLINNQITILGDHFGSNLEQLNLSKNKLKTIDGKIDFPSKILLDLDLSFNKNLESLPSNLLTMFSLRSLNLNNCTIKKWEMKEGLTNHNLKELRLNSNQLQNFELSSKQLPSLKSLQLANNKLTTTKIAHLEISNLNLSKNKLTTEGLKLDLPFALNVNLYENELNFLPPVCLIAPNLEQLDLNKNYITTEQGKAI